MPSVRVEDVIVLRTPLTAEPLPDGLAKRVYDAPIILRGDMVLIDGYRRLLRAKEQGRATINAIVSSDYPTLCEALKEQNNSTEHRTPPRRVYQVYDLIFQLGVTWTRSQGNGGWVDLGEGRRTRAKAQETRLNEKNSARMLLVRAFNYSETAMGFIIHLYKLADGGSVQAQELAKKVDAGIMTAQRASQELSRPYNLVGNVSGQDQQDRLLERGTAGLSAQMDALMKLGYPIQLPAADVAKYVEVMHEARRNLTVLINGLRKFVKEEEIKNG